MSITLENHNNNNLRITFPVHGLDSGVMTKEALAFSSGPVPLFLFKFITGKIATGRVASLWRRGRPVLLSTVHSVRCRVKSGVVSSFRHQLGSAPPFGV